MGTRTRRATGLGIYLPVDLSVPIFMGGLIAHAAKRLTRRRHGDGEVEERMRPGMLFAAGLITGEALVGILLAIPIAVTGKVDVLSIADNPLGAWPGLVVMVELRFALYRVATPRS